MTINQQWYGDAAALLYYLTAGRCQKEDLALIDIGINPVPHANYKEVESIQLTNEGKWKIILNLPGLIGPLAALPQYDQVTLITNNKEKSDAVLALFNIFHQRLLGYQYITWLQKRPVLNYHLLHDFNKMHEGSQSSTKSMGYHHQALVSLAGQPCDYSVLTRFLQAQTLLLRQRPLSRVVIESLLRAYFKFSVTLTAHLPSRCMIPKEEQTRLVQKHHANQLGKETVLGKSLWLCAQRSFLTIGPLSYREFLTLLPGGKMLAQLKEMLCRLMPAK